MNEMTQSYSVESDEFISKVREALHVYTIHSCLMDDPNNQLNLCEFVARTLAREYQKRLLQHIKEHEGRMADLLKILNELYKEFEVCKNETN